MVIELMRRSDFPLFRIVTVLCDVLPVLRLPKLIDVALTDILGGPAGFVPVCVTVKVWPAMVSVPVRALLVLLVCTE